MAGVPFGLILQQLIYGLRRQGKRVRWRGFEDPQVFQIGRIQPELHALAGGIGAHLANSSPLHFRIHPIGRRGVRAVIGNQDFDRPTIGAKGDFQMVLRHCDVADYPAEFAAPRILPAAAEIFQSNRFGGGHPGGAKVFKMGLADDWGVSA